MDYIVSVPKTIRLTFLTHLPNTACACLKRNFNVAFWCLFSVLYVSNHWHRFEG